jgi:Cytochrome c554 and c-prime
MTKLPWWKRSLMAMAVVIAAVAALAGQPRQGRSAEAPEPVPQAPAKQEFRYFGSKNCGFCHNGKPNEQFPPDAKFFVKLDEYKTWDTEDKHRVAFARLTSKRGQDMAALLKLDVTKREAGCLGCHSAGTAEAANRNQNTLFDPSEGVSCENCHGPYEKWGIDHTFEAYRSKSTADRTLLGMIDVRVPEIQANQCLSCHIGSAAEGKVVTHDMYAAGHPPLPSIEVATFTNFIPRHWWLVAEKNIPKAKEIAGFKPGDLEQTKLALVGAAVALKTSMKLLADEAKLSPKGPAPGEEYPDYARFDCWSCHHDLVRESWRQQRGYVGAPGRVPVSEWPLSLVELAIDRLGMDDPAEATADRTKLHDFTKALRDQADTRPFGRKAEMAKVADDFANWSETLVKKVAAKTYNKAIAETLLRKVVENEKAKGLKVDYDSARHVSWMIKLLVEELGGKLPNQVKIDAILLDLEKMLNLTIPAGRKFEIENNLKEALERIGAFEPAKFQEQMEKLLPLL